MKLTFLQSHDKVWNVRKRKCFVLCYHLASSVFFVPETFAHEMYGCTYQPDFDHLAFIKFRLFASVFSLISFSMFIFFFIVWICNTFFLSFSLYLYFHLFCFLSVWTFHLFFLTLFDNFTFIFSLWHPFRFVFFYNVFFCFLLSLLCVSFFTSFFFTLRLPSSLSFIFHSLTLLSVSSLFLPISLLFLNALTYLSFFFLCPYLFHSLNASFPSLVLCLSVCLYQGTN